MEEHHSLGPHDSLRLLSYITQHDLPRGGITHSGVGPPTSIINQKKIYIPQAFLLAKLMEAFSSQEIAWVMLTKQTNKQDNNNNNKN